MAKRFRARYVVTRFEAQAPTIHEFATLLRRFVEADAAVQLVARSPADDELVIESYDPVQADGDLYDVDHNIGGPGRIDGSRVRAHLEDVLGIPQFERTGFDIRGVIVSELES